MERTKTEETLDAEESMHATASKEYVCPYCGHRQQDGGTCEACGMDEYGAF